MKKLYCRKCGLRLIWKQDEAQKHINGGGFRFSRYNPETGTQQIVGWWECPKSRWWNNHDYYIPDLI